MSFIPAKDITLKTKKCYMTITPLALRVKSHSDAHTCRSPVYRQQLQDSGFACPCVPAQIRMLCSGAPVNLCPELSLTHFSSVSTSNSDFGSDRTTSMSSLVLTLS
ncbi:hypothetical protein EVAR_21049_1 [Eumeta japonica]|uniref:Uncharacterized protein n=1 Tax=Eumeta variegata TaxID=151549 RepID=A0A4C1V153_EUMVA|nr:hypothetical protein EVAR_21049_1 [Eumeta japonica]